MRRQVSESARELAGMSSAQRDQVFRGSPAGEVPRGSGDGVALLPLGRIPTRIAAGLVGAVIWKGKVFDPRYDGLRNRLTPLNFKLIRAKVSLRDVQIAARHADPRTTMRYDRARKNLDRHPNYILAAYMASGT